MLIRVLSRPLHRIALAAAICKHLPPSAADPRHPLLTCNKTTRIPGRCPITPRAFRLAILWGTPCRTNGDPHTQARPPPLSTTSNKFKRAKEVSSCTCSKRRKVTDSSENNFKTSKTSPKDPLIQSKLWVLAQLKIDLMTMCPWRMCSNPGARSLGQQRQQSLKERQAK